MHFQTMANHCLLVFAGELAFQGCLGGAGFRPSAVWNRVRHQHTVGGRNPAPPNKLWGTMFFGMYRGTQSLQLFVGAGFCASTVCSAHWASFQGCIRAAILVLACAPAWPKALAPGPHAQFAPRCQTLFVVGCSRPYFGFPEI